ncbi:MAG TPA: Rieske 2Fe-2S domain-containing protein [Chloroflexota bacterium]|jgi:nitrite reductase/ring-hydroxylating ferredoxin subunit/uncharacterized membrane protein|nr:Rieske 2Fe-2S domain-containing protein [Chloroflexota bacterium]
MATPRDVMRSPMSIVDRIAAIEGLDGVADKAAEVVKTVTSNLGRGVTNGLHGTWLGHPLHPALTDVPLGAWSVTFCADLLEMAGARRFMAVADTSVAVGLAGAVGSIATGWNDWQHTYGRSRRIGLVHALLNGMVTVAYTGSMAARMSGNRGRGKFLSMTGYAMSGLSAYLGGVLVYSEGIGVDHARGVTAPPEFKRVMLESDLPQGQPQLAEIDGSRLLLLRRGNDVSAIAESCAHLGGPLSEGELNGDVITCPWHGSRFNVRTGELIDGPSVYPQPCFTARIYDGWVEVRQ